METMNFLAPILIFISALSVSMIVGQISQFGPRISYIINLFGHGYLLYILQSKASWSLTDFFLLDGIALKLAHVAIIFNLFILFLNGGMTKEGNFKSLLSTFMLVGGIFLLGATELVSFFIALEIMSLIGYVLVALGDRSESFEASIKYFIQGAVMSAIFLLGMAFIYGGTGSFDFNDINIKAQFLFVLGVALVFATACFKLGAFPFHSWMPDVYSNVNNGPLAANFLLTKMIVGYSFITLMQKLLSECAPEFEKGLVAIIIAVAVISAFYGNMIGLVQNQYRRIIAYSSLAHSGYMLLTLTLPPNEGYEKQLAFYLAFYSIAACGALLTLNELIGNKKDQAEEKALEGCAKNQGVLAMFLTVFVLSLAGIPLTSGFSIKYLLFTNYFRDGMTAEALTLLISSVIGLGYYLRFLVKAFMAELPEGAPSIVESGAEGVINSRLVQLAFFLLTLAAGVVPSFFLR